MRKKVNLATSCGQIDTMMQANKCMRTVCYAARQINRLLQRFLSELTPNLPKYLSQSASFQLHVF